MTPKQWRARRRRELASEIDPWLTPGQHYFARARANAPFKHARQLAQLCCEGRWFVNPDKVPEAQREAAETQLDQQWSEYGAQAAREYVAAFINAKYLKP